jgi:polyisoprenoid-binding protein YceI
MAVVEQQIPAGVWSADKVHSTVGFEVKHMVVATFRGGFEQFDAGLTVGDDGDPRLTGVVGVDSVQARDEDLTAHLQSPEFFDAERHPELLFESTSFRRDGEDVVIDGDLTIRGVTKPVEARGTITDVHADPFGGERIGLDLTAVVDRTEFGLDWNQPLPKGGLVLADDVKLVVHLELVKAE